MLLFVQELFEDIDPIFVEFAVQGFTKLVKRCFCLPFVTLDHCSVVCSVEPEEFFSVLIVELA